MVKRRQQVFKGDLCYDPVELPNGDKGKKVPNGKNTTDHGSQNLTMKYLKTGQKISNCSHFGQGDRTGLNL